MRMTMLFGIATLVAIPATAEEPGSRQTREYVQAVAQSDAFEMLEADTVLAQSDDPQVRAFAQQMLRDHRQLDQALRTATSRAGLAPPPTGVGADQAPLLGALQSVRGPDFDRAYWRHQALAHRSALTTTQRYATTGNDPTLRQAAVSAGPVIAAHLATAERIQAMAGD